MAGKYRYIVIPSVSNSTVPTLTRDQMVEVDRLMIDELGIDLARMMENAGRNLARLVVHYAPNGTASPVIALAGTGGNGGGALVAARRLAGWGFDVQIITTRPRSAYSGVIASQLAILDHLDVPIHSTDMPGAAEADTVIIDGLVGYSLVGSPRGRTASLITWANAQEAATISLDVPSGFSAVSESVLTPAIFATATLTLALPKQGFASAGEHLGTLYGGDIGVPASVYSNAFGIGVGDLFATADIVEIRSD